MFRICIIEYLPSVSALFSKFEESEILVEVARTVRGAAPVLSSRTNRTSLVVDFHQIGADSRDSARPTRWFEEGRWNTERACSSSALARSPCDQELDPARIETALNRLSLPRSHGGAIGYRPLVRRARSTLDVPPNRSVNGRHYPNTGPVVEFQRTKLPFRYGMTHGITPDWKAFKIYSVPSPLKFANPSNRSAHGFLTTEPR